MRKIFLYLLLICTPLFVVAAPKKDAASGQTKEITMTTTQAMKLAGDLVERGDYNTAQAILTKTPPMNNGALEIERWFLLGQIAQKQGDYETAIKIYRKILDQQPDLARIRFELATCYMQTGRWYRADHHLRLAMAGKDLPETARNLMNYYRYIVRQNKRWNVWFNFGAAPDNNINNASGGQECVNTIFGMFCRDLTEPVSAVGYNMSLGGNYEFLLSEQWRWKSDANIYANVYNHHDFDDLYISASTGPRFIWNRGDIWVAGLVARRLYGWHGYNWSAGARTELNYDFTRRLSGGMGLRLTRNMYDKYGLFLNGETYSSNLRLTYSFNASVYLNLRTSLIRETTANPTYSYWQPGVAVGIGAELPFGFHIYCEPSFYWSKYDKEQWIAGEYLTANDFMQRYAVSVSNNKVSIMGFVPTLVFSYTRRNSNIWQREYDKFSVEFTMQQRF